MWCNQQSTKLFCIETRLRQIEDDGDDEKDGDDGDDDDEDDGDDEDGGDNDEEEDGDDDHFRCGATRLYCTETRLRRDDCQNSFGEEIISANLAR